jgi:hypothetical protein
VIPLPAYIDADAWAGFVDMRKAIKKPLTFRAASLVLYELQRIKDAGHDANEALDQSTNHCWADVYVPKMKEIERAAIPATDRIKRELDAIDAKATKPPADLMDRVRNSLRRVA